VVGWLGEVQDSTNGSKRDIITASLLFFISIGIGLYNGPETVIVCIPGISYGGPSYSNPRPALLPI